MTVAEALPEANYHRHPALSVSGAKKLLPPSCPAIFKHERDHGTPHRQAFDVGHAAHGKVLGVGEPVVVIDAPDYRGKDARAERDAAYAEGKVPVLTAEWRHVEGMAEALSRHPVARDLFVPGTGKAELSLFWADDTYDIDRRARFDWLAGDAIVDFKTCQSAAPSAISRAVATYRYHMQAAWYMDAARACGITDTPLFFFAFQEKQPPYAVNVVELDEVALAAGRRMNDKAMAVYAECLSTDTWPTYSSDVELVGLPKWALYELEEIA